MSRYRSESRPLAIRRLAHRVIWNQDQEAAIVLGDYQHDTGLRYIETGRTRPATFEIHRVVDPGAITAQQRSILSDDELTRLDRLRTAWWHRRSGRPPTFHVPARERIYNLNFYAAKPSPERWQAVYTMWITPPQATYRALVRAGLLPRTIRFGELRWHDVIGSDDEETLREQLYLQRNVPVGPYLKSRETFLMTIRRRDPPGGPTDEEYPGRPGGRRR